MLARPPSTRSIPVLKSRAMGSTRTLGLARIGWLFCSKLFFLIIFTLPSMKYIYTVMDCMHRTMVARFTTQSLVSMTRSRKVLWCRGGPCTYMRMGRQHTLAAANGVSLGTIFWSYEKTPEARRIARAGKCGLIPFFHLRKINMSFFPAYRLCLGWAWLWADDGHGDFMNFALDNFVETFFSCIKTNHHRSHSTTAITTNHLHPSRHRCST